MERALEALREQAGQQLGALRGRLEQAAESEGRTIELMKELHRAKQEALGREELQRKLSEKEFALGAARAESASLEEQLGKAKLALRQCE
jgi:hypothetical protein